MKFNKETFKKIGTRALGVAAGGGAAYGINKMLPNMNQKTKALIKVGAGILLPVFAPKSKTLETASDALAGVGVYEAAQIYLSGGTGVQGIGNDPEYVVEGNGETTTEEVSGNNDALGGGNDALGNETEF